MNSCSQSRQGVVWLQLQMVWVGAAQLWPAIVPKLLRGMQYLYFRICQALRFPRVKSVNDRAAQAVDVAAQTLPSRAKAPWCKGLLTRNVLYSHVHQARLALAGLWISCVEACCSYLTGTDLDHDRHLPPTLATNASSRCHRCSTGRSPPYCYWKLGSSCGLDFCWCQKALARLYSTLRLHHSCPHVLD